MISYQLEDYHHCHEEIDALLPLHWQHAALPDDPPFILNKPYLFRAAEMDVFHVFTARDDGKLVGYVTTFVQQHPHHVNSVHAATDSFWLHPDHRKGMTGVTLFRKYEEAMRELGVEKIIVEVMCHFDVSVIFDRLGWTRAEIVYSKRLQ